MRLRGKVKGESETSFIRPFFPFGKKAMGIGQVFIFIIAAITFAVIMIFGYSAISDFVSKGEQVEFYQFKTDLETGIKKIYTEYGSVRVKEFSLLPEYERICFIDLSQPAPEICNSNPAEIDIYACEVWKGANGNYQGADQNVFLHPLPAKDSPPIKVYQITMENNYLCLEINKGKFKLRLEGLGDRTRLSKVEAYS